MQVYFEITFKNSDSAWHLAAQSITESWLEQTEIKHFLLPK